MKNGISLSCCLAEESGDATDSDDEEEDEDEEDADALEPDLDKAELLRPAPGELAGDRLLYSQYCGHTAAPHSARRRVRLLRRVQSSVQSPPLTALCLWLIGHSFVTPLSPRLCSICETYHPN